MSLLVLSQTLRRATVFILHNFQKFKTDRTTQNIRRTNTITTKCDTYSVDSFLYQQDNYNLSRNIPYC